MKLEQKTVLKNRLIVAGIISAVLMTGVIQIHKITFHPFH